MNLIAIVRTDLMLCDFAFEQTVEEHALDFPAVRSMIVSKLMVVIVYI